MRRVRTNLSIALIVSAANTIQAASVFADAGSWFSPSVNNPATVEEAHSAKLPVRIHYTGNYWTNVRDDGALATPFCYPFALAHPDLQRLNILCFSGWMYPARTNKEYLARLEILVGTVQHNFDTLVSSHTGIIHEKLASGWYGTEFTSLSGLTAYSNSKSSPDYSPYARAEQEYHAIYTDTILYPNFPTDLDYIERRYHKPIGIEVHQSSYSWSQTFARQFLIIRNWIVNISEDVIQNPAVGIYLDADIIGPAMGPLGPLGTQYDDICGYTYTVPSTVDGFDDTLDLFWSIDNDGDPSSANSWGRDAIQGAIGLRMLNAPAGSKRSYNWWATRVGNQTYTIDWGPRSYYESSGYAGGLGVPRGDRGKYRMMVNGEFDYPQVESAQDKSLSGWARPLSFGPEAVDVADGLDSRFLVSFYGFGDIAPGDSVPLDFAIVCGDGVHRNPGNFVRNFDPRDPRRFMESLDFSTLYQAARWAGWVYDKPGLDSDPDDGIDYRGEYYLANCSPSKCDTIYYRGDGIPDLSTVEALPPPSFAVTTGPQWVKITWNGYETESAVDHLSLKRDFEGYRLYLARQDREDDYAMVASWDRVDFMRVAYNPVTGKWNQISDPMTVQEWRNELALSDFDPTEFDAPSFLTAFRDTVYDTTYTATGDIVSVVERLRYSFWAPEGANCENECPTTTGLESNLIRRVEVRDTVVDDRPLSYGIYEVHLENLNAATSLYAAVTAFEYTDFESQLPPLETTPVNNSQFFIPIYSSDVVIDSSLGVSVYPNPYKYSYRDQFGNVATYYSDGFEVADKGKFREQDRRIWFINLPDTATIRIWSLDGDLIREIHHPDRFLTKYSSAVGWDLISRNTQAVVSGIYIWRVDSRIGSQVGKLVIIK